MHVLRQGGRSVLLGLAGVLLGLPAAAQTVPPLLLPPPTFTTEVVVRDYCSGGARCPTIRHRTRFVTDPSGVIYASDTGMRYPINGETKVTFPTEAQKFFVTEEPPIGWAVGSAFAGDVLTLYHNATNEAMRLTFKERIRFYPGGCEVLSWEQWGLSGGYPLAKALVSARCSIAPPAPVVRVRAARPKPRAVKARPRCICAAKPAARRR